MNNQIDLQLKEILLLIFNKKFSKIDHLKINSFDEWDSVNHFYILLEIEKKFNLKFDEKDFFELDSIEKIKKYLSKYFK